MESIDSSSKELINQKKNTLLQLWTKLKHSIFDVLFVVMDKTTGQNEDVTIVSLLYESGIDYLQMMQFPFTFTIIMVWNGGETLNNIFNVLTNIIGINNLLPGINYNAFLVCLYLIILMIVLVIIDIIYVSYSFTKKKFRFTLPLVLLAQIVPLFVTFLFIPISEFLLTIINCNPSDENPNVQTLQFFPDVICFQGAHLIHVSITMFFTSIFVFISTIVAMTLFQPRMTANTIAARKSSDGEVIFIVNKIICQFFFSFTPFTDTWIYIVLMFFPALWLFYFYHFHQPYYNRQVGKLYRILSAYYFWTVLMLTFSQICLLLQFDFEGSMVIWFCGLPFIGMNISYQSKSNIDNLFSSNLKFKSGQQLQAHLLYVLKLIHDRKDDQNANMLLVGYIQKHIETCLQDDCPIKVKKPKKEEPLSEMDQNCKLLIIQIQRMYKQGIKKFPSCTKLHISFALFYMERLKQNAKAYEEFVMAEKADPSFVQQFIIYRFKKIIKEKLQQNKEEQNDLIEVIRFDNHVSLCEQAMLHSAKLHKQFWTELVEQTPNLLKLNQNGGKIIQIVNNVKLNYNEVKKINSHSPQIIHNYGVYSMFIAQNISQGKKCLEQAKRAYYQKKSKGELLSGENKLQLDDANSCVVVSASSLSMGKILSVNHNFVQMCGYLKEQITQKSIEKILPQVMTFYHDYAMNRWLNDSSRRYMNAQGNKYFRQIHNGFVKQKNGFIIPVLYKVNYSIFQQKFNVYLKHQKEFNQNLDFKIYIITDHKGVIKDISSLGYAYFNLTKENLSSAQRYVDQFGLSFGFEGYFQQDGAVVKISKKPIPQQNQNEQQDQNIAFIGAIPDSEKQTFEVTASKVLMPYAQEEEEDAQFIHLKIDGRRYIGTVFVLRKIVQDRGGNRDLKMDSLDKYGKEILDLYEANEQDMSMQQQKMDEDQPLLIRQPRTSKNNIQSAIYALMQAENQQLQERTFHNYGQKIKTYRLVNHDLKRVVEQYDQTRSDYDEEDQDNIAMSNYEMSKLKNPLFVKKILAAINTNIEHHEVNILKIAFSILLLALTTITVLNYIDVNRQFSKIKAAVHLDQQWINDQYFLSNLMHLSYNVSNQTLATTLNYAQNYSLSFDPNLNVQLEQSYNNFKTVRLNQAMLWVQGHLLNFFRNSTVGIQTDLMLKNYYLAVYPALQTYQSSLQISYAQTLIFFVVILMVSIIVVSIWIYNAMVIDIKCFDIILWFLDIPVSYVSYLQANCNTYIKSHISVKELIEKGINFHDRNLYLQDYQTKDGGDDQQDKFNQESKSRKIMIARYKKKTMLSRCDCGYIQLLWLLFYSLIFFLAYFLSLQKEAGFYRFLNKEWTVTAKQLLWSSTIPNNLRLTIDKNVTQIGSLNFTQFQHNLQLKFLNPNINSQMASSLSQLLKAEQTISEYYKQIFEGNICEFPQYNSSQSQRCKSYLEGRLQGGINSIFAYYPTLQKSKYIEIQYAQYDFVNRHLLQLFTTWNTAFTQSVSSTNNLLTLCLALYIIVSLIGFFLLWMLYLNRLNVKLNQTIQMLNMIPMKMLPKGRKDIRDFFHWIITEANKNKTDQE